MAIKKSSKIGSHNRLLALVFLTWLCAINFASANSESIATGNGRSILRPARSVEDDGGVREVEAGDDLNAMKKRSMSLGRLSFRPGKRFLPVSGAFAHDPTNRRYELLLMDDEPIGVTKSQLSHIRFRLMPNTIGLQDEEDDGLIQEAGMGKRSAATGRFGFRPAKRSMAVGRTGFRPGKRSIATGRVGFRPGKRSTYYSMHDLML